MALSLEGLQTSSLQQERRSKRGSLQGAGEQSAPRLAVSDKNISKKDIVIFCLSKTITTEVVIFLLVSGWNLQNVILDFRSPTCILHLWTKFDSLNIPMAICHIKHWSALQTNINRYISVKGGEVLIHRCWLSQSRAWCPTIKVPE